MKRIEDAPKELQDMFDEMIITFEDSFGCHTALMDFWYKNPVRDIAKRFFIAGYEAAIAERAKFDEENGLIVKEIGEQ